MGEVLEYEHWASLILKKRMKTISDIEEKELAEWIAADEQHKRLYECVKSRCYVRDIKTYQDIDIELGLKKFNHRYGIGRKRTIYRWASAAAIVTIIVFCSILLRDSLESTQKQVVEIYPGSAKAELVLSDGSVKQLEQHGNKEIIFGCAVVSNTGSQIEYISKANLLAEEQDSVTEFNELRIPMGGEYRLVLSDGTKVWLNSQTQIRFPVNFTGKEREVYLEGEAYFEVTRDEKRPFMVRLKEDVNVQVLGTAFNIRAYADENTMETVLEHGAVRMWRGEENALLEPGFRGVYSRNHSRITSMPVNTELFTAWREGQFIFQGESIENILQKLSRWYGMNVFFLNEEAKNITFSGNVRKYETINNLLEAIEISGGVHFEIKENTIQVSLSR